MSDLNPYEEGLALELKAAQDRIEALTEQLAAARRDAEEAEAYAGEVEANGLANRVAIMRLEAKLATCEKYRDAYAECDRIGTQAVRDLEAKLAKQEALMAAVFAEYERRLAKAVEALETIVANGGAGSYHLARTTLAEIKGGKDD